jgi:hypothetical protein
MPCRKTAAVCSEIPAEHVNTLCWQSLEFLNVKPGGAYSKQLTLKGSCMSRNTLRRPITVYGTVRLICVLLFLCI